MTALEHLLGLRARGVRLEADGEALAVDAPAGTLTPDDRAALVAHKAAVLALLRAERPAAWLLDSRVLQEEAWLVRDRAALDLIRAELAGRPVFYGDELKQLRAWPPDRLRGLAEARAAFPEACLVEPEDPC